MKLIKLRHLMLPIFIITLSFSAPRPDAEFLLIPPTAKATGMAYAWTAIANDASANYYNSAGLAFIFRPEITLSYFKYLQGFSSDMSYIYFAGAYPLINSSWGFDIIYFNFTPGEVAILEKEYRDVLPIWDIAAKLTYANRITQNLSIGLGVKYIYEKYRLYWWEFPLQIYPSVASDGGTTHAYGIDLNCLWYISPNLSLGTILHNLGSDIYYSDLGSKKPLPRLFRLGIAYRISTITFSCEITKVLNGMFANSDKSFFENLKYEIKTAWKGIGIEFVPYRSIISLRCGYFYDYEGNRKGITFGGGVRMDNLEINIGIDEEIFEFPTQNRKVSFNLSF